MTTTRDLAREHELAALKALANLGAMSTKQLGIWVYKGGSAHTRQVKMQRVLARLETRKLVLRREIAQALPTSPIAANSRLVVWVLTRSGADTVNRQLDAEGYREWAHHGTDLGMMLDGRHQAIIEHLTDAHLAGELTFGRAALRAGVLDKSRFRDCDAVTAKESAAGGYTVSGVVYIGDYYESTVARVRSVSAKLFGAADLTLIGEPRRVRRVREKIGQP